MLVEQQQRCRQYRTPVVAQTLSDRQTKKDRLLISPALFVMCFVALGILLPELISEGYRLSAGVTLGLLSWHILFLAVAVLAFLYTLAMMVYHGARSSFKRAFSYALAGVFVVLAVFFVKDLVWASQYAKIAIFRSTYTSCAKSAVQYADSRSFKVCSIRDDGNVYAIIVYDSGGEVELTKERQSEPFRRFISLHESPVLSECSSRTRNLVDHFYFVQSACP
jgi:hypothetical protein